MLRCALIAAIFASVLAAADVTGKWTGRLEAADRDTVLVLKSDGASVTGTMSYSEGKDRPLKGKIEGEKISFTVDSEWQGSPVKLLVNGTVNGDEMKLTVASDNGQWSSDLVAKRL